MNDKIREIEERMRQRAEDEKKDAELLKQLREPNWKPTVRSPFRVSANGEPFLYRLCLDFPSEEQAEVAKEMLEGMEFGPPPFKYYERVRVICFDGSWRIERWCGYQYQVDQWHQGHVRKVK